MIERLGRTKRNLALALIGALVLWFCWSIRSVVNPLLIGYLCAFILHPMVEALVRRGMNKRTAVNVVFVAGFVLFVAVSAGFALQARTLIKSLWDPLDPAQAVSVENPTKWQHISEFVTDGVGGAFDWAREMDVGDWFGEDEEGGAPTPGEPSAGESAGSELERVEPAVAAAVGEDGDAAVAPAGLEAFLAWARDFVRAHGDTAQAAGRAGLEAAGGAAQFLWSVVQRLLSIGGLLFLVPLYAYYLLFELERVHGFVRRYVPRRERARFVRVAELIGEVIANFFRGRLLVCLLKGGIISAGLLVAGVDYAFLFGMLGGFLSIIPFFGPFLGFLGALLLTYDFAPESTFLGHAVRTAVVFFVAEMIEGYVLVPKIMGDSLGLHPLVVFFALLAGGASLGMFGVLIALPLSAALVIVVKEFVLPALEQFADEAG